MNYYDYDESLILACKHCGWSGKAKDGSIEYFDQLMVVDCPACLEPPSLLMVEYPTIAETKEAAAKGNDEAVGNLPVAMIVERAQALNALAEKLVRERIAGHRKGMPDVPAYTHSIRVAELLKVEAEELSWEACLAGLLHDILEDGNTSTDELVVLGFPSRVIELVDLCSHDINTKNSELRWMKMMIRLAERNDTEAWTIKVADMIDNLRSCHSMPIEKQRFMKSVKAGLLLRLSKPLLDGSNLWKELEEIVNQENN